jgi:hypothetical protein
MSHKRIPPYICPICNEPCYAKSCDDGIGPYEFWGEKGFDSRPYLGSDCCEADLTAQIDPDDFDYGER